MTRPSAIATVCLGITLLFALVFVAIRTTQAHRPDTADQSHSQALHARWQYQNLRALLALSAVKGFSTEERTRLQQAGNDQERTRQVLIQIHEERLATAGKDLDDAQQRKVELSSGGGYKVYADQPQPRDLVALANQDEWTATAAISRYAEALRSIRAWQPVTYEAFLQNESAPAPEVAQVDPAQTQVAPAQKPEAQPQPVSRRKPDPRVPMHASADSGETPRRVVVDGNPASASAPRQPEATDDTTRANVPDQTAPAAVPDSSAIVAADRGEAAIRETLREWAEAMTLNNPRAEAAAYAPHLDRYFLRTDVNQAFVQADKAAYLRRGNRTASFALQDVHIENLTGSTADVRLVKDVTWAQSQAGSVHKLIRSQLWLAKTDAGWKITGERDFR